MMDRFSRQALTGLGLGATFGVVYNMAKSFARRISYKGKVVLISGGSRGLGLVLAKEFAKRGSSLVLLARNSEELQKAKEIINADFPFTQCLTMPCDSRDRKQVQEAVGEVIAHFGHLDAIVNNAGVIQTGPIENSSDADFKESIDTHFWASYNVIEESLPYLKQVNDARIINIGSIGGLIPVPHLAAYCAGKFALEGYSKTLHAELMKDNIHVTTVSPGLMRTGSIGQANFKGQPEKEYAWFSISSSLPGLTVSAEKAAKEIINASQSGKAELIISWPAKLAVQFESLFPEMFADILSFTNALLPGPGSSNEKRKGMNSHSKFSPSKLTKLSEKAAQRNNERSI